MERYGFTIFSLWFEKIADDFGNWVEVNKPPKINLSNESNITTNAFSHMKACDSLSQLDLSRTLVCPKN